MPDEFNTACRSRVIDFIKWLSRYFGLEGLISMHSKCHIMLYSSGIQTCR